MQKRKLGNSGLEVSAIGFGSMGLSYQADVVIQNLRFIDFLPLFRGTTAPGENQTEMLGGELSPRRG